MVAPQLPQNRGTVARFSSYWQLPIFRSLIIGLNSIKYPKIKQHIAYMTGEKLCLSRIRASSRSVETFAGRGYNAHCRKEPYMELSELRREVEELGERLTKVSEYL